MTLKDDHIPHVQGCLENEAAITILSQRLQVLENGDNSETFKALGCSVFEGTANLQEELVLLKMKLENSLQEFNQQYETIKHKLNEIIRTLNK